jgi:hypothetical protein
VVSPQVDGGTNVNGVRDFCISLYQIKILINSSNRKASEKVEKNVKTAGSEVAKPLLRGKKHDRS